MIPGLTYDPLRHEWRDQYGVVPSVTQVLRECGLIDGQWFTEEARLRGQYVAEATALIDDNDQLDEEDLHPALLGYCKAWRGFKAESKCVILGSEEQVSNAIYRYAGTLDRRVMLNGIETIVDIKTGAAAPWHGLQLAGYAGCFGFPLRRAGVYLRENGEYGLVTYADETDLPTFLSAVTMVHWKAKKGKGYE